MSRTNPSTAREMARELWVVSTPRGRIETAVGTFFVILALAGMIAMIHWGLNA